MTTQTNVYHYLTEGIEVHEIVTVQRSDDSPATVAITSECSECGTTAYTGGPAHIADQPRAWMQDHIDQHAPGGAVNLDVMWHVSADCTVCDDGGDIIDEDSETLRCQKCQTTWAIDGTFGQLADDED